MVRKEKAGEAAFLVRRKSFLYRECSCLTDISFTHIMQTSATTTARRKLKQLTTNPINGISDRLVRHEKAITLDTGYWFQNNCRIAILKCLTRAMIW
ncbi:hypothetical protein NPIL_232751 [Nephila pilipes]|uniref:Uncharacterized protein n=1 Tax=Nephila pilipes TaxID=299642 RepID=A0A8X6Q7B9_NEPPI|nr:hypothetical protein NPIL_232751 [Nephila pilipes]